MQRIGSLLVPVVAAILISAVAPVSAAPITYSVVAGSQLTLNLALPDFQRQTSVSQPLAGTIVEDTAFTTLAGFGTVVQSLDPTSSDLTLGSFSGAIIDLEFLGKITYSGANLGLDLRGPVANYLTALGPGRTRLPLAGSSLVFDSGSVTLVGEGIVAGAIGTRTIDFQTTPVEMPFGSTAVMEALVSGDNVTLSIPTGVSGQLFGFPLPTGTIGVSGTITAVGSKCILSNLIGDADNNGNVGAADYAIWAATFGQTGACLPADFDRNGNVGAGDYALWAANFGRTAGGAGAAVPEPSTGLLALFGLAGLLGWACRRR